MWSIRQSFRNLINLRPRGGNEARRAGQRDVCANDWLPPVINPGEWTLGLMADRSAGWYFDRN